MVKFELALIIVVQIIYFIVIFSTENAANITFEHSEQETEPKYAADNCNDFPANKRKACKMMTQNWSEARKAENEGRIAKEDDLPPPSVGFDVPTLHVSYKMTHQEERPPPKVMAERYACLNMTCLCPFLRGNSSAQDQCTIDGKNYGKATRMEYRMLSDDQRNSFHSALLQLKHANGSYEYDRLADLHTDPSKMPSAHGGPTFALWHREFLKRIEIAIRAIDPSLAFPYWDSSLDEGLPNPADSIIWSNLFLGSTNASDYVVDGFLANWITPNNRPVQRHLAPDSDGDGRLMKQEEIDAMISVQQFDHIFAFTRKVRNNNDNTGNCPTQLRPDSDLVLEVNHNNVHLWVGGDMYQTESSAYDPLFFLHHSFIDYIWEQWRQKCQNRSERETQFHSESLINPCSGSNYYRLNETMLPFLDPVILNRAGLSNEYTDNLYTYAPRPTCQLAGECGSPYLFCDTSCAKCYSRIKPGGNCSTFVGNGEEPCYASTCTDGICQCEHSEQKPFFTASRLLKGASTTSNNAITTMPIYQPNVRYCYDNHECCAQWAAKNVCQTAPRYMNTWCPGSCQFGGCQLYTAQLLPTTGDIHSQCKRWAHFHEHCDHGEGWRAFMPGWVQLSNATRNECQRNIHWMAQNCAASCADIMKLSPTTTDQCSKMPKDYRRDPPINGG